MREHREMRPTQAPRSWTAPRALILPDGRLVAVRVSAHAVERLVERVRHALHPDFAGAELVRLLAHATVHTRCPQILRSSPHRSDLYIELNGFEIWMPAVVDPSGVIVIKTVIDKSDARRHETRKLVERKRRTERTRQQRAKRHAEGSLRAGGRRRR